ncbi:lipopolysaccharide biosynthesis protein [Opacimonas viscosa]|uniref:Lipopolysaccharide biosynthesis protein n=1 Tax=Opacimonas viscosa TaxID=2961944 RepID=A0AA41X2U4_9ALTE|nr:lipopolysaccharide biosynthesis protein [Opacimonas viscosa]MCP3428496.1 lipopolysaccharide biosynthesis protein [Opacimonas viscosa]
MNTSNAISWQVYGGVFIALIRFLSSMVLARYLSPDDFGLYGLAILFFTFISTLGSVGFSSALVRKSHCSDVDYQTCFWLTAASRFVMFSLTFIFLYPISVFFNEPVLISILAIISFNFLISLFEVIPNLILVKNLNYKVINIIQVFATLLETMLILTLVIIFDYTYWALVFGMLFNACIVSSVMLFKTKWKPSFQFSKDSYLEQANFGWNTLGFSIMNYLTGNLDYLIVSKTLGTYFLGIYEFAYRIPFLIHQRLVQPIGLVIYPSMSKLKGDRVAIFDLYSDTIYFLSLIVFPVLGGMLAVADIMVIVVWGEKWVEVIPPLQILALCTILRVWPQSVGAIFMIDNRPDIPFKISIVTMLFTLFFVSLFSFFWGIVGVAWGMVFSLIPSYFSVYLGLKRLDKSFMDIFRKQYPIIIVSIIMVSVVFLVKNMLLVNFSQGISLLLSIMTGFIVYPLVFILFFRSSFIYILEKIDLKYNNYRIKFLIKKMS